MKSGSKYLRASAIVALTGMSIRTVRRRIGDKTIPSTKLGGARLVAVADLEAALSPSYEAPEELSDDTEEYDDDSSL